MLLPQPREFKKHTHDRETKEQMALMPYCHGPVMVPNPENGDVRKEKCSDPVVAMIVWARPPGIPSFFWPMDEIRTGYACQHHLDYTQSYYPDSIMSVQDIREE